MLKTALLGALLVPATCFGGTLTATTRNDAEGGIFLNLIATHQLWTTPGLTVDVAPGSYIGFDSTEVGQTLRETLAAIGAGSSISQNTGNLVAPAQASSPARTIPSDPSLPSLRITAAMKTCQNDKRIILDHEIQSIGKSPQHCPPHILEHDRKLLGISDHAPRQVIHFRPKPPA